MADSLRDVCKKNQQAIEIVLKVKRKGLSMAHRRLQENGLSTSGLTKELMERLARFDIRNQIPNIYIEWDNAVDLASNSEEQDGRENLTESRSDQLIAARELKQLGYKSRC